ncbi:MAG: hypothetical protein HN413_02340 [Chloroflexi bacterium]|jgi:hypothetical protein|nr:hypothetical protein [Chloroflexota bacterium]
MNIIRNDKSIKRNAMIGKVTSIVSLAILAAGMYVTFKMPEKVSLSLSALLIGFVLSQMGIYYTNRWGRNPRPDEQIDAALKGFSKQYFLYHYTTVASHVLVGPAGVWVLLPKPQKGTIIYHKNRWKKRGGGALGAYLSLFAQEGLGRPDIEITSEVDALKRALRKQLPDEQELPLIEAALVFTHPDVDIQANDAPSPTLSAKKLKDFLRKSAKNKPLSADDIEMIVGALGA